MKLDAVREHVRRFLNRTLDRRHPDFADAASVLAAHPTWSVRLGDVLGLRVRRSRLNGSLQLQLRTNRVWFTVSWTACAERSRRAGATPPERKRLYAAMRGAIRPQICAWRRRQLGPRQCALCGNATRVQVDHVDPPFERIRTAFLEDYVGQAPTIFALGSRSSAIPKFRAEDSEFNRVWMVYHATHARYQFLCAACNRRKSNRSGGGGDSGAGGPCGPGVVKHDDLGDDEARLL